MQIGSCTLPLGLILAPMAGFTDAPMRAMCRRYGAEFAVTEMVSAAALCYGDRKTAPLAAITERDAPASVQLFGHDPAQMEEAAARMAAGEYRGACTQMAPVAIDLNMGCPVRKIVTAGDGSALMRDPNLCAALVRAAVRGASCRNIPVTVKIRAGWDEHERNAVQVAVACVEAGASAVTVHGRTRAQMYAPSADWSVIADVRAALPAAIPVIGNGDVTTAADFFRMKAETGCDGVAIGRAALGDPWLFAAILAAARGKPFTPPTEEERRREALTLARETVAWASAHGLPETAAVHECRGRCAHFLKSMRGAAAMRAAVNRADTMASLADALSPTDD